MYKINNIDAVSRLSQILNYEIASSTLFLLSYMYGVFLILAIIAAILFTPYLLYVLFKERRVGWIILFAILVILPLIISLMFGINSNYSSIILQITLVLFYLYCFSIRMSVREWVKEYNWSRQLEAQKREKHNSLNNVSISDILN